jgi:hypothetical protein
MKDPDDNTIEITGPYDDIGGEWDGNSDKLFN